MNKFHILDDGVRINKISKTFGKKQIIRDVSLYLQKGEIVGLLGPRAEISMFGSLLDSLRGQSDFSLHSCGPETKRL